MKLSCMASTAPSDDAVLTVGEQRRLGHAEAHLLAFHVAAGLRIAGRLLRWNGAKAGLGVASDA